MGAGLGSAQIHSDRSGGAGGGAPTGATYIVVSLDATLTAERTLVGEIGVITTSDAGAGLNFTIGIAASGVGTPKIADNAVTYSKIQDVSAGQRLLGRFATVSGDPQEITVTGGLQLTTGGSLQIATQGILTSHVADQAVTYVKIQNISNAKRLLGRFATTSGSVQEITIGTNLTLTSDGVLDASAGSVNFTTGPRLYGRFATTSGTGQEIIIGQGIQLTTDGTIQLATQGILTSHIADNAVTYAKIQDVSVGQRLLGRFATTSGDIQEITVTGGLELATAGGSLQIAALGVDTAKIAAAAVTYVKIQNVSVGQRLLGRFATVSGVIQEIQVGTRLALTTDGVLRHSAETLEVPVLNWSSVPDVAASGTVWTAAYDEFGTNDVWDRLVVVFSDSATRHGMHSGFRVPPDYGTAPSIVLCWTATVSGQTVVWDVDYRAVGVGESLDQTLTQESVTANTAVVTPHNLLETSLALTGANFAAGDQVECEIFRDGVDAADTLAASAVLFDAVFRYSAAT